MRVPACAMFGLLAISACQDSQPPAADSCDRAPAPAAIEPLAGTWQLVVPEHADNEFGVPQRVFDLVDTCEGFVSLSHSVVRGGKEASNGPSELLTSAHGELWVKRSFGIDNAFRDIAYGGGKWVAVGHGTNAPGAIAVSDSLDGGAWREVFQSDAMYFNSVAYGANTFVAVTHNGVVSSRDGETWSWASVPSPAQYFEVAFGNGHFVVAGVGATLSSTDGQSWRQMQCEDDSMCQPPKPPPGGSGSDTSDVLALQSVRFVGEKFYAFGASGQLVSSDALTFQRTTVAPDAAMSGSLIALPPAPSKTELNARLSVFLDGGSRFVSLPYEVVEAVDCRALPCVAIPAGILAFVAD